MEKAEYGDLERLIKTERICESYFEPCVWPICDLLAHLVEPVAKSVTLDVTHALQYVHSLGIAHRDLKPSVRVHFLYGDFFPDRYTIQNILIFSLHPLITKVCDFGLAKPVSNTMVSIAYHNTQNDADDECRQLWGLPISWRRRWRAEVKSMASLLTAGASVASFIICELLTVNRTSTVHSTISARLTGVRPFEARAGGIKYDLNLIPLRGKVSRSGMCSCIIGVYHTTHGYHSY